MATVNELVQLKARLESARANVARLQGRRDALLEDLKAYGVKSVADGRKLLAEKEKGFAAQNTELENAIEAFRIKYKV